jgi:hypothetical protein
MRQVTLFAQGSLVVLVVLAFTAPVASAQSEWGLRGGFTFDPDQIHVGAHATFGEFFTNGFFVPNVEIGFGNDATLIAINPELVYRFSSQSEWGFYAGGGLGINIYNWDDDGHGDGSNTDLGVNILGGARRGLSSGNDLFLELKLGLIDSPDAKITIGVTFG